MSTEPDPLLDMLKQLGFRRGTFTLTSGKTSDFFIDCKPAVLRAEGHRLVGAALLDAARAIVPSDVTLMAVAGVELGGCSLASAAAMTSVLREGPDEPPPLDCVYVRKAKKEHGTQKQLEGAAHLPAGAALVVLEDTVTTGGSTLRAVESIRAAGFDVAGVVAVVDRCEGAAERIRAAGLRFSSLYRREDFMGAGEQAETDDTQQSAEGSA